MYQHLLVLVDSGDLAIDLVGHAIGVARPVAARLAVVHIGENATPGAEARVQELLAKADAAARAAGVPSRGLSVVGEDPAAAIAATAQRLGCDLIVLGAPGRVTAAALGQATPVPVMIVPCAPPPERAIEQLRAEHRALSAVLQAWRECLLQARSAGRLPAIAAQRAALDWLRGFTGPQHHGKESEQLFHLIRQHTSTLNAELDELEHQHRRDGQLLLAIAQQLARIERLAATSDPAPPLDALLQALQQYIDFVWDHLGREEGIVLPAAQRHLQDGDWQALDLAFDGAGSPIAAVQAVLDGLNAA